MSKIITPELINQRLEAKGFGEKQMQDEDSIREAVLNHFGYELTDEWDDSAEFFIYAESTADGYEVFIATANPNNISIGEDVHYYDNDLSDELSDAIQYGNGDPEYPEKIYVDDLDANYIDEAVQGLFEYLSTRFEEEVINELIDEGYEHEDTEVIA